MNSPLIAVLVIAFIAPVSVQSQTATIDATHHSPRFEDYPVAEIFKRTPAQPVLTTPKELKFQAVIGEGVSKGWGVYDGATGEETPKREPNFAGHYFIVTWGCGSPCLMAAIVDAATGRVYPMPYHSRPGHDYFQVPWPLVDRKHLRGGSGRAFG